MIQQKEERKRQESAGSFMTSDQEGNNLSTNINIIEFRTRLPINTIQHRIQEVMFFRALLAFRLALLNQAVSSTDQQVIILNQFSPLTHMQHLLKRR